MDQPENINFEDCDIAFHLPNPLSNEQLCIRMSLKEFCQRLVDLHPAIFISSKTLWDSIGNVLLLDVGECPADFVNDRIKRVTIASELSRRLTDVRVVLGSMDIPSDLINNLLKQVAKQGAFGSD